MIKAGVQFNKTQKKKLKNYLETGRPDRQLLLKSKHEVIEAWNRREESGLKEKTTWRNLWVSGLLGTKGETGSNQEPPNSQGDRKQKNINYYGTTGGPDDRLCLQCGRTGIDPWVRKIPWRRIWQPTSVFLPCESCGQTTTAGYSPWGGKGSNMTERLIDTWPYY